MECQHPRCVAPATYAVRYNGVTRRRCAVHVEAAVQSAEPYAVSVEEVVAA